MRVRVRVRGERAAHGWKRRVGVWLQWCLLVGGSLSRLCVFVCCRRDTVILLLTVYYGFAVPCAHLSHTPTVHAAAAGLILRWSPERNGAAASPSVRPSGSFASAAGLFVGLVGLLVCGHGHEACAQPVGREGNTEGP